jgi:predicted nucleic acid-binding protein
VILVDTSVWIDYFNAQPSDEAAYLTFCIAESRELVIPGLVLTEMLLGVRDDAEAARITRMMSVFELTPELERADYEQAAGLYRACRARGITPRSTIDCLIAQLCLRYGYELLARDRDFAAIAQVSPLKLTVPALSVQERAAHYGLQVPSERRPLSRRRASAPRRSSRA